MPYNFTEYLNYKSWPKEKIVTKNDTYLKYNLNNTFKTQKTIGYRKIDFFYKDQKYMYFQSNKVSFISYYPNEIYNGISKEHQEILNVFGYIIDINGFESHILKNISELFSCDEASSKIDSDSYNYISEICQKENCSIDYNSFTKELFTFAYESNGNRLLYDRNGDVFYYAKDHLIDDEIMRFDGFPINTFYTIPQIKHFTDFIYLFIESFDHIETESA